jgi:hypothetical protein
MFFVPRCSPTRFPFRKSFLFFLCRSQYRPLFVVVLVFSLGLRELIRVSAHNVSLPSLSHCVRKLAPLSFFLSAFVFTAFCVVLFVVLFYFFFSLNKNWVGLFCLCCSKELKTDEVITANSVFVRSPPPLLFVCLFVFALRCSYTYL